MKVVKISKFVLISVACVLSLSACADDPLKVDEESGTTASLSTEPTSDDSIEEVTPVAEPFVGSELVEDGLTFEDADVVIEASYEEGDLNLLVDGASAKVSADVSLGQVVALEVESDVSDHVHVHGHDLLLDIEEGVPARIVFTASIPGSLEVELEDQKVLLLNLTVR